MKKLLFVILSLFALSVRADNTITSKEYVDGQVTNLQTQIPAKNVNTVVMNTDTAGEIGEKAIYDTTAAYGAQSDALVTAGAFNSAVQNALESEFVCIEWQGNVHDNAHCLLYEVKNAYHKSKNLFDVSKIRTNNYMVNNGDGSISLIGTGMVHYSTVKLSELAPDLMVGHRYVLSFQTTHQRVVYLDDPARVYWNGGSSKVITQDMLDSPMIFYTNPGEVGLISNIQIEQGTVATPYVPYGNVYMPQGGQ